MISKVSSIATHGLIAYTIQVEIDIAAGLPAFTIVGLPDSAIQESRERVRSAIKNSGYSFPRTKIITNLAPADIRKSGPSFDLPIAIAILVQGELASVDRKVFEESIFLGELSLDGELRPVSSILPSIIHAKSSGYKRVFVPEQNVAEASLIPDIDIISCVSLDSCIQKILIEDYNPAPYNDPTSTSSSIGSNEVDFGDVIGQDQAKRALLISAAGGHNLLMEGPPGSGKTMLAKCFSSILPKMTYDEIVETTNIYSVAGLLTKSSPLISYRPFRKVHHTASAVSIIGGGRDSRPGEISLAHNGVLFLDEMLEFPSHVLETLRQPIEDNEITITRVHNSCTYPASFTLVGSLNPCPCGFLGDNAKPCICSAHQIEKYRKKLSGPLVDRMDLFVHVPRVDTTEISKDTSSRMTSSDMLALVQKARDIQNMRFNDLPISSNASMNNQAIETFCKLDEKTQGFLHQAVARLDLSTRAYFRILRLARTIADLEGRKDISFEDIAESISYREKK